jgi:hypothetical protein
MNYYLWTFKYRSKNFYYSDWQYLNLKLLYHRSAAISNICKVEDSSILMMVNFKSQVLSFAPENPNREYLPDLVYSKYTIESISFIFIINCIFCMRNPLFSKRCDYGYKFTILTLSKNCGFAIPIFLTMIFSKKRADTTYCDPPFIS